MPANERRLPAPKLQLVEKHLGPHRRLERIKCRKFIAIVPQILQFQKQRRQSTTNTPCLSPIKLRKDRKREIVHLALSQRLYRRTPANRRRCWIPNNPCNMRITIRCSEFFECTNISLIIAMPPKVRSPMYTSALGDSIPCTLRKCQYRSAPGYRASLPAVAGSNDR